MVKSRTFPLFKFFHQPVEFGVSAHKRPASAQTERKPESPGFKRLIQKVNHAVNFFS